MRETETKILELIDKREKTTSIFFELKNLYEKIVLYIEDFIDKKAVENTDFSKVEDFEKVAEELGI